MQLNEVQFMSPIFNTAGLNFFEWLYVMYLQNVRLHMHLNYITI